MTVKTDDPKAWPNAKPKGKPKAKGKVQTGKANDAIAPEWSLDEDGAYEEE